MHALADRSPGTGSARWRTPLITMIGACLAASLGACGSDTQVAVDTAQSNDQVSGDDGNPADASDAAVADASGDSSGVSDGNTQGDSSGDVGVGDSSVDSGVSDTLAGDASDTIVDAGSTDGNGTEIKSTDTGINSQFPELLVKILSPSGRDWGFSEGAQVQLSGVAYGAADTLQFTGSASGTVSQPTPPDYWVSPPLKLVPGDNLITVTATKGTTTAADSIHITYNPLFHFESGPHVNPDVVFAGQNQTLVVNIAVPQAAPDSSGKSVVDPASIQLIEVDGSGAPVAGGVSATLYDVGDTGGKCDDVQKDSVFSNCVPYSASAGKTTAYFRVQAAVTLGGNKITALSPVTAVDIVTPWSKDECKQIVGLQKNVRDAYKVALASNTAAQAQASAIATLKADSSVAEAGPASGGGYGIWVRYKTGRVGALNLAPAGLRGGAGSGAGGGAAGGDPGAALPTYSVGARRALALAPGQSEFEVANCVAKPADATACGSCPTGMVCDGSTCRETSTACGACSDSQICVINPGDEAAEAGLALAAKQCPPFSVDQYSNDKALLSVYRNMELYGLVALSGHGEAYFEGMDSTAKQALGWEHLGSQEVLWSGEAVNCDALAGNAGSCSTAAQCSGGQACALTSKGGGVCVDATQADILHGRLVIGADTYGMAPAFFQRHLTEDFPSSIIYMGGCRTMFNGSLAVQLFGAGAQAVVGWTGYVSSKFAYQAGRTLFDGMLNKQLSINQGVSGQEDPDNPGSRLLLVGNGKANVNNNDLINPSWDTGNLVGWKKDGDGRVISRLGVTIPVAGKYMGIVSTGMGFTVQTGSLEQPFCVQPMVKNLTFYWKFYSEEFEEFCMSPYMDKFTATLQADTGKITMVDVWIDALCPYDCGGKAPCDPGSASCKCGQQWKGLTKADVSFDVGDVWMTDWQKSVTDVSALAGANKRTTLKFFASDAGDSIYDTAVLIDAVTLE